MVGNISYFDIFFAVIILISSTSALFKGLSRELLGIVMVIVGFGLAIFYYRVPGAWVRGLVDSDNLSHLCGFLAIFLGCMLLGAVIGFVVNRFLKAVALKWLDRLLGALFGFLRGWIVCTVLVLAMTAFPLSNSFKTRSLLVPYLLGSAGVLVYLTPHDLRDHFERHCEQILRSWQNGDLRL